ncbi:glycoside hydrolase family 13 protein [Chondrinema litorale]|uniref:glycoside hydrolase family 13 protein n=1 Tax=Chondrinema litorale TaxID=2994555 RepID=UPI0025426DB2|nr:alpha-glucosidase [Chondrinema litorale]UZR95628.1 alpha-glucosidase [Chondrinema litorale]
MATSVNKQWWKESVIYQIYPRSFNDSNGDGVGDLPGIIEKLDYLQHLGIDVIWLCPFYSSPNDDNGYDISDYYGVLNEFGTIEDVEKLLEEAQKRNIKIIIDLVVNHSSDEHQWFVESRKSKDNPYRDYYIWHPPVDGKAPNNWVSFFSGSAWQLDEATGEYYLHLFTKKQPDLNWENDNLRKEIYDMMHFWLQKGVAGFRMDVIPLISKKPNLPSFPAGFDGNFPEFYASGPRVHEFLKEMNREVLSKYDIMTVGEGIGVKQEEVNAYVGQSSNELNMVFHFGHMFLDRQTDDMLEWKQWSLVEFKEVFEKWEKALGNEGWGSLFLGNHDFPRIVSRFGNDEAYRVESAKLIGTLLFTLKGTPYIYQGDEIGMTNVAYESMDDYNDVQTLNAFKEFLANGGSAEVFLPKAHLSSRDNARTPVQWDNSNQAGFTTGTPWLKVNPNYKEINVAQAVEDENSIFNYYRKLIQLRKRHEVLVYGDTDIIDKPNTKIYAYTRTLEDKQVFVVLNFSAENTEFQLPQNLAVKVEADKVMLSNYPVVPHTGKENLSLKPYEGRVYLLF